MTFSETLIPGVKVYCFDSAGGKHIRTVVTVDRLWSDNVKDVILVVVGTDRPWPAGVRMRSPADSVESREAVIAPNKKKSIASLALLAGATFDSPAEVGEGPRIMGNAERVSCLIAQREN